MQDLDLEGREQLLSEFKSHLMQLYPKEDVCKWLVTHLDCFDKGTFQLSKYLCANNTPNPTFILQISRVCELPGDLDDFLIVSNMLHMSNRALWVEQCLKAEPMQEKISFVAFA